MIVKLSLCNECPGPRACEGDICTAHAYGTYGGKETRKHYLFINVDFGDAFIDHGEACAIFNNPLTEGGHIQPAFARTDKTIIAKKRYNIKFSEIDKLAKAQGISIEWKRVRDREDDYQPLIDAGIVFPYTEIIDNKASGLKLKLEDLKSIRGVIKNGSYNI